MTCSIKERSVCGKETEAQSRSLVGLQHNFAKLLEVDVLRLRERMLPTENPRSANEEVPQQRV